MTDALVVDLAESRKAREKRHQVCGCHRCDPEMDRVVREWVERQSWWSKDKRLTEAAVHYHGHLNVVKPSLTVHENLAEVERFLRSEFPDKFPTDPA